MDVLFTMHDGKEFEVFIEDYRAKTVEEMLNNRQTGEYISFGASGFMKNSVKYWEPLETKDK